MFHIFFLRFATARVILLVNYTTSGFREINKFNFIKLTNWQLEWIPSIAFGYHFIAG